MTGRKVYLNLDKVREAAAGSWVCDDSKARDELGFRNPFDLATRIAQTAENIAPMGG